MNFEDWLSTNLGLHERLTDAVVGIISSLLSDSQIDYLSVTGRTKDDIGIRDKIKRKNYKDPINQLTDISGVRVILFIESDVERVCQLIESAFTIDIGNSSNRDLLLGSNQVGYRSVHFVCELGGARSGLPEFSRFHNLKFEIQVRTVLQHAWAELAHDRSYKFRNELPQEIQRKLNLYAGLLEIADKGFSEIAEDIDAYSKGVSEKYKAGNLEVPINSLSLLEYMKDWAAANEVDVEALGDLSFVDNFGTELIHELAEFGITTIKELDELCPKGYADEFKKGPIDATVLGIVRSWMLIKDAKKLLQDIGVDWVLEEGEEDYFILELLSTPENFAVIRRFARGGDF